MLLLYLVVQQPDIAVTTLNLKKNDEIILPTFTIISSIHQIIRLGLKPIFVDSDKKTWNMDERLIEKKLRKELKQFLQFISMVYL